MNPNNEGLTRLLADSTRMKIYQAVAEARGEPVTVSQISETFGLHVNVARMHLEKLANAGLLTSRFKKHIGGGGRPAREYLMGEKVLNCQFPPRDYELLADMALASVTLNTRSRTAAQEKGREVGVEALSRSGLRPGEASFTELLAHFERLTQDLGLFARVAVQPDGTIDMQIYNCVFKELSAKHLKKVCQLHQNMIIGLCESHFGQVTVKSLSGLVEGKNNCGVKISLEIVTRQQKQRSG